MVFAHLVPDSTTHDLQIKNTLKRRDLAPSRYFQIFYGYPYPGMSELKIFPKYIEMYLTETIFDPKLTLSNCII